MANNKAAADIAKKFGSPPGGADFPQWMRRCFMTGKQCIFCPQETVVDDTAQDGERDSVFVIMPFKPVLDAFFDWSLKPYLEYFGFTAIHRADRFADTGYVMCERICLRIQQAAFVVVDLSIVNENVFYELGIAVGLHKIILPICDRTIWDQNLDRKKRCEAVGIDPATVLLYPNVGHLDAQKKPLMDYLCRVTLQPKTPKPSITTVLVREPRGGAPDGGSNDICITFEHALEAAIGVAVSNLSEKNTSHELVEVFSSLSEQEKHALATCRHDYLTSDAGAFQPFERTASLIDTSLISVVDLALDDPLAYFWLGYCHGRNINVIPIHRRVASAAMEDRDSHVLAFDVRALWYMVSKPQETKQLATKLATVFEPILIRDVTTRQRRMFWERITRSGRVHIYNGAVHYPELKREVVGDWDLRTASELISYLSSSDESVIPVLQSPIYAPETIADKLRTAPDREFNFAYIDLVRRELRGKNCLIIASADVNPITEIVLAYGYERDFSRGRRPVAFDGSPQPNDDTAIIAQKGGIAGLAQEKMEFKRRFAVTIEDSGRGFLIDGRRQLRAYSSQDDSQSSFDILAHLVVMKNPFSPETNFIVVLNGVSGPATFALAEALTGGAQGKRAETSEKLLREINRVWSQDLPPGGAHNYNGVEAILEVKVAPPEASQSDVADLVQNVPLSRISDIDRLFYDKREVQDWRYMEPANVMKLGNPRPFPIG